MDAHGSPPRFSQMRRINGVYARSTAAASRGRNWFLRQKLPVQVAVSLVALIVFLQLYSRYVLPLSSGGRAVGGNIGNNGLAPADSFMDGGDLRGGRKDKGKRRRKRKHSEERAQGGIRKPAKVASTALNTIPASLDVCDHAACTGQTKVVAISLYGGSPRYTTGAVRNSEIMRDAFPDWQLWVYVPDPAVNPDWRVPDDIVATLEANGARILIVDRATIDQVGFGMNQRFLPAEDASVDRFASRDGDSRLLLRERWAMDEWEEADVASAGRFPFHVLRDHPSHSNFKISGGLWGAAKGSVPNIRTLLASVGKGGKADYMHDMDFLNSQVWPIMRSKGSMQHDAFSCAASPDMGELGFPRPRAGAEHVGGVYDGQDIVRAGDVALLPEPGQAPSCSSPDPATAARYGLSVSEVLKCSLSLQALLGESGEFGASGPSKGVAEIAAASSPSASSLSWSDYSAPSCHSDSLARLDDPTQLGLVVDGGTKWKRYGHEEAPRYRGLGVVGAVAAGETGYSALFHWRQAFVEHGWWASDSDSPSGCASGIDNSAKVSSWADSLGGRFAGNTDAVEAEGRLSSTAGKKAIVPPSIFDYDRALLYSSYPLKCLPEEWLKGKPEEVSTSAAGRSAAEASKAAAGSSASSSSSSTAAAAASLPLPAYAQVSQYHTRISRPHTHYTSLGPGGLRQSANLLIAQALYSSDPHFIVSHAVPFLWYFLHSGPVPYRHVLVPEGLPAVDDVMSSLTDALGIFKAPIPNTNAAAAKERGSYPKGAEERNDVKSQGKPWNEQPWVSLQSGKGGPSLHYAHRAYVAALSGDLYAPQATKLCSSVSAIGELDKPLARAVAHSATATAAHATLLFADSGLAARDRIQPTAAKGGSCSAVLLRPSAGGSVADQAAGSDGHKELAAAKTALEGKGWKAVTTLDPCSGGAKEHLEAFGGAGVAVIPPQTLSPYLSYLRKGAKVLIASDVAGNLAPSDKEAVKAVEAAVDSLCDLAGLECIRGDKALEMIEASVESC